MKAHSSCDGGLARQAGDEDDFTSYGQSLHHLTTSDIGVGCVDQRGWDKAGNLGDIGCLVGAVEDVVLEDGLDDIELG